MKSFSLIALLLLGVFSYGQITFEKGYFITDKNEVVSCFIRNVDWRNNPSDFSFKTNLEDRDVKIGNIDSAKEFGIGGAGHYKRFSVKIEHSTNELGNLDNNRNPVFTEEVLFLKFLVEGEANLYSYTTGGITKYFYDTPNIQTEQLIYITYLATGDQTVKTNNYYRQQLAKNVSCGSMNEQNTFGTIPYYTDELIKHFKKYNSCRTGRTTNESEKKSDGALHLKFTFNPSQSNVKITNPDSYYDSNTEFKKTMYKIGLEAEYFLPFNNKIWSVFANPSYNILKNEYEYLNDTDPLPPTTPFTLELDYSSIEIPMGIRYHFHVSRNSKIFADAGAGYDLVLNSAPQLKITGSVDSEFEINSGVYLFYGVGFNYKNFGTEIRLSGRDFLERYKLWTAKHTNIGFVLSYQFL